MDINIKPSKYQALKKLATINECPIDELIDDAIDSYLLNIEVSNDPFDALLKLQPNIFGRGKK